MKIIVGLVFGFWVVIVVLLSDGAQVSDGKISGKQYHFKYVFQCETFFTSYTHGIRQYTFWISKWPKFSLFTNAYCAHNMA